MALGSVLDCDSMIWTTDMVESTGMLVDHSDSKLEEMIMCFGKGREDGCVAEWLTNRITRDDGGFAKCQAAC